MSSLNVNSKTSEIMGYLRSIPPRSLDYYLCILISHLDLNDSLAVDLINIKSYTNGLDKISDLSQILQGNNRRELIELIANHPYGSSDTVTDIIASFININDAIAFINDFAEHNKCAVMRQAQNYINSEHYKSTLHNTAMACHSVFNTDMGRSLDLKQKFIRSYCN